MWNLRFRYKALQYRHSVLPPDSYHLDMNGKSNLRTQRLFDV
jgi:hypothetical protein